MNENAEKATRRYARGVLRAFLEDRKNLNWVISTIESSGMRGQRLVAIFDGLKGYGNPERYQEALAACRELGWLG